MSTTVTMERPEVAKDGSTVIVMPTWVLVVRILQFILSIIILGCAAWFIHGLYLNALGFAIACVSGPHVQPASLGAPANSLLFLLLVSGASRFSSALRRLYNTMSLTFLSSSHSRFSPG